MQIELQRTFGKYTEPQLEDADVDWYQHYTSNPRRLNWDDLQNTSVTVVLGEAGIGKTAELQLQAARMKASGRPSFFIPLNELVTVDWELALGDELASFQAWLHGSQDGFFFLDAVDEARLQTHADFKRAILAVRNAVAPNIQHAKVVISSRVTDWTELDVQKTVNAHLLRPISQARARAHASALEVTEIESSEQANLQLVRDEKSASADADESNEELNVVTLDALSKEDAYRCARCYELQDEAGFWSAVDEGDYEFMASRPLDLQWMVRLWNQRRVLGTYAELIEANIGERLREPNELYRHARRSLAEARLREGATELAAAMEFGGIPFIAVRDSSALEGRVLDTFKVLDTWSPPDVQLLLTTAIFDEASFDRVKFHHRSVREYLAAKWVDAKLVQGVPFSRLESLFVGKPSGALTLIPSRRPVLAWLAAINVQVRAWVVSKFPEILLHGGDPQSWDQQSADLAFKAATYETQRSVRIRDWYKSVGEYLRIGRALSPGQVASVLEDPNASWQGLSIAYRLARHGRIYDCAGPAFEIYRGKARFAWEKTAALAVLEAVGTPIQREHVLADIEAGAVAMNEMIAAALACVSLSALSPARLAAIFRLTQSEGEHGTGPMADTVRRHILPKAELASATLVLQAVLLSLPRPLPGQRFEWYPSENAPERAWLLYVLPHCLLTVLNLTDRVDERTLPSILDAAQQVTTLRHTGFSNKEETKRIREAINQLPELRWQVAVEISKVKDLQRPIDRLVWDDWSIVSFGANDLPGLTRLANEPSLDSEERDLWFGVGVEVAIRLGSGKARAAAMRNLRGLERPRSEAVLERYQTWRGGARSQRKWKAEERARQAKDDAELLQTRAKFLAKKASIESGADSASLARLVSLAHHCSAWGDNEGVKLDVFASQYGAELTDSFSKGLQAYWKLTPPPNPSDFQYGQVPWEALTALAGVSLTIGDGTEFSRFSSGKVTSAAQIAAWALPGPPSWFEPLYRARSGEVAAALNPWVLNEVTHDRPGTGIRGAFVLAMHCPVDVRRSLIVGAERLLLDGSVKSNDVRKRLVHALYEDGLMSAVDLDKVCQRELEPVSDESLNSLDFEWLRIWAAGRPDEAWTWYKERLSPSIVEREIELSSFAASMDQLDWIPMPWDPEAVRIMLDIAGVLRAGDLNTKTALNTGNAIEDSPIKHMLYVIGKNFANLPGSAGRNALQALVTDEFNLDLRSNFLEFLHEHAERDVGIEQQWSIARLRSLHSAFDSAPQSEAQLFDQVIARLEEIRTGLEEGPFSERSLFSAATSEKQLQLWLAAKFCDTQNCRFSVHREEEVDDDKKTDIQLSSRVWNVCVEIKPVDATRSYSANSLTDTLQTQIVEQYLKGNNSSRGILVLMQLDRKTWDIPGGKKGQPFEALVEYLQQQALRIKESSLGVNELIVFPMRCVI